MTETDRMIMVKLGHESKMRGFSEGKSKAGGDCDLTKVKTAWMDFDAFFISYLAQL